MSPRQTKDDRLLARPRGNRRGQKVRKEGGGCLAHSPAAPVRAAAVVLGTCTCSRGKGRSRPRLVTKDQPLPYREAQTGTRRE